MHLDIWPEKKCWNDNLALNEKHSLKLLMKKDKNAADVRGKNRERSLVTAAKLSYLEIVDYLTSLENVNINNRDYDGATALIAAAINGHLDIVKYLTSQQNLNINSQVIQHKVW